MSALSAIEWTDRTWNPVRGCSVISPGCVNCYAMKMAHRFSKPGMPFAELTKTTSSGPQWTGTVRTVPDSLLEPLSWRKPQRVFVNSMSDLFHEDVPLEFIEKVFSVMDQARRHTFQIVTKRPLRMREVLSIMAPRFTAADGSGWPLPNVWLGVSVEDQQRADERIPLLLQTPAAVRFVSAEPLLGPIRIYPWLGYLSLGKRAPVDSLNWVIVGGESGPGARPCAVSWIRSIVQQCQAAGVPVFVKQLGAHVVDRNDAGFEGDKPGGWPMDTQYEAPGHQFQDGEVRVLLRSKKGGDMPAWPDDLRVRELPG